MLGLIRFLISLVELWFLFTICYALSKKDSNGKLLIKKKLSWYAMILFVVIYFLINIAYMIR